MAKPIKETPILSGKDAEKFLAKRSEKKDRTALAAERARILRNYEILKAAEGRGRKISA